MLSIGEFDAIIFTLFSFAAVSTILRIYARRFVTRCTAVDDYLMIAALVRFTSRGFPMCFVLSDCELHADLICELIGMRHVARCISPSEEPAELDLVEDGRGQRRRD